MPRRAAPNTHASAIRLMEMALMIRLSGRFAPLGISWRPRARAKRRAPGASSEVRALAKQAYRPALRPPRPHASSGSGRRHHAIVDAVRPVGRLEPRIAAEIVGRAADIGCGAAGRRGGIDRAHRVHGSRASGRDASRVDGGGIGAAGGDPGRIGARGGHGGIDATRTDTSVVGACCGGSGVGRGNGSTSDHTYGNSRGGGAGGGPASAVVTGGSVVVHRGGRVIGRIGAVDVHGGRRMIGRAVVGRRGSGRMVRGCTVGPGRRRAPSGVVRGAAAILVVRRRGPGSRGVIRRSATGVAPGRPLPGRPRRAAAILIGRGRLPRPRGMCRGVTVGVSRGRALAGRVLRAAPVGAVGGRGAPAAGCGATTLAAAAPGTAATGGAPPAVATGFPGTATAGCTAVGARVRPGGGRSTREHRDQETHQAHRDRLHDAVYLLVTWLWMARPPAG